MSYEFYKVVHLFGVVFLLAALGGISVLAIRGESAEKTGLRRTLSIVHGIALLFIFVAGFGLLARLGLIAGWPAWVWGKLVIWLLLGASLGVVKRKAEWGRILLWVVPLLAATAAFLAITKPGS